MNKKQLTAADRGAIEALLKKNYTQVEIAKSLGVHRSTVSRELKTRGTPSGYFASLAQEKHESLRQRCRKRRKLQFSNRQNYLCEKLQAGWSPEQISGRMKLENNPLYICKETIYKFLYGDNWAREEKLYEYLRYGRKKRRKQTGRSVHRSKIPNRVSIHERPAIVEARVEYGHCEGDSVIYPYKMAINTINELKTGIVRYTKLERKTAENTARVMTDRVKEIKIKSYTLDNGSEFTNHETITMETGIPIYFADPYSSWQRGSNENSNMLLRGYLPKRCDIRGLTQEELDDIAEELNNRPRKRFGYKTPNEIYYSINYQLEQLTVAVANGM